MELALVSSIDAQGRGVLAATGAVDIATRDELLAAGRAILNDPELRGLALDLSDVGFIDSSGIGVLVELAGDAEDLERAFVIVRASYRVTRILDVSGLSDQWPTEE